MDSLSLSNNVSTIPNDVSIIPSNESAILIHILAILNNLSTIPNNVAITSNNVSTIHNNVSITPNNVHTIPNIASTINCLYKQHLDNNWSDKISFTSMISTSHLDIWLAMGHHRSRERNLFHLGTKGHQTRFHCTSHTILDLQKTDHQQWTHIRYSLMHCCDNLGKKHHTIRL